MLYGKGEGIQVRHGFQEDHKLIVASPAISEFAFRYHVSPHAGGFISQRTAIDGSSQPICICYHARTAILAVDSDPIPS